MRYTNQNINNNKNKNKKGNISSAPASLDATPPIHKDDVLRLKAWNQKSTLKQHTQISAEQCDISNWMYPILAVDIRHMNLIKMANAKLQLSQTSYANQMKSFLPEIPVGTKNIKRIN